MFSLTGTEMVGVLADETERQREALPQAYHRIPGRLLALYLSAILILGITVSPKDPLLQLPASYSWAGVSFPGAHGNTPRNYPGGFIVMAERAAIPGLPNFINLIMIIGIISAATADVYFSVWLFSLPC